jgi:hypothetical protein
VADSSYYTFSPYPSTMQKLVVDGDEVGQHYTMHNADGETVYCARVDLPVDLPPASITARKRSSDDTLQRFGPVQKLDHERLDKLYEARSDGYPFPKDLMNLGLRESPHGALSGRPIFIQSLPGASGGPEPGGLLVVDVVLSNEREDLEAGIELAKMLARAALRIAAEDRRYQDAYEVLTGGAGRGEPSPEQLEAVMQHIAQATSWVTGNPARVADAIETRLRLDEVTEDMRGTLHVYWQDANVSTVDVHLDGGLPAIPGASAKLEAAETGFWAFLKSLGELKTGDQDLDDAFFIKSESDDEHPARNLILHSRDHLVELGRYGAHVDFTPELLKVRISAVPYDASAAAALIGTLLELWRRTVLYRAGFAGAQDPTAR